MESRPHKAKKAKTRPSVVWKKVGTKTFSYLESIPYPDYGMDLLHARLHLITCFQELGWNLDKHYHLNTPTVTGLTRPVGVLNFEAYDLTEKEEEQFFQAVEELHFLYPKLTPYMFVKPRRLK
jgi:hypothetical protein